MKTDIQNHLPLTEATFFILLSLTPGPKHGYGILKDVQALSQGRIVLSAGTLYGALKRLLDQDWIKPVDRTGSKDSGRSRKLYALTELGRRVLSAESARLEALVRAARTRAVGQH